MTAKPRARSFRRRDLDIYETLASGFTPEQVAVRHGISVALVRAAERRVRAGHEEQGEFAAARHQQRHVLGAVVRLAMQAFQRSALEGEVVVTIKTTPKGDGHQAQRTVRTSQGDTAYLQVALKALAQESRLLRLDEPPQTESEPAIDSKFLIAHNQALLQHPDLLSYVEAFWDEHTGQKSPPAPGDKL